MYKIQHCRILLLKKMEIYLEIKRKKNQPKPLRKGGFGQDTGCFSLFKGCFLGFYSVMSKKDFKDHLNNNTPH